MQSNPVSAETRTEVVRFIVTDRDMADFARLSGDDNPLHHDAALAADGGFQGPVVYGGLLVAQVSRLLGTRLPGHGCVWRSLTLKFRSPLHVGQEAVLTGRVSHANEEAGLYLIDLRIESEGRTVANGEAQASLMSIRGVA